MSTSPASPEASDTPISGYLQRRFILGIWSKRLCTLIGTKFSIYKDDQAKKLDMAFDITPNTQIEILEKEKSPRFLISQPNGDSVTLEAESSDSMMHWILSLRECTFVNPDLSMSQFKILAVIGRGFYGKVMLVQRISNGEVLAIKSIHKSRLIQSNKVHTVIAERNILTRATHPFIVSLKFAFQTPSKFYLGLEYAPGGELFYHMQKRGNLTMADTRLYIAEIALALNHLHTIGIVYRDLKPENILLDAEGHIKLTDFGLSKDLYHAHTTTTFCGTSEYLAPEIVKHEPYGIEVDWWAVGILTYELMFGRTPFNHPNRARLFQNIVEKQPTFPPSTEPQVVEFITAMLAKDPKKRPKFEEVQKFSFFGGMNFDDVLAKKITPTFAPRIESTVVPTNFDSEFTQEAPADSYVMPVFGSAEQYPGFSYVGSSSLAQTKQSDSDESADRKGLDSPLAGKGEEGQSPKANENEIDEKKEL